MRAREFVTEYKKSREEFEGMTIEMTKNGHVLVINALDDWGNNVLGSVAFNIGDNNDLDPQELKVDERYQGQGIARAMYDYAKSKGYTIHRSYDQTPAGAGFWNKHRGEDVRVWEAFDRPYKTKTEKSEYGDVDMLARLPDGTNLSIMFNNQGDDEWQVEFYRNNSQEVTGEGDAQRVFATVLTSMQKFIKKYKPWRLTFSANKDVQPGQNSESRAKLYNRLVQRYATAWGYEEYSEDHGDQITYELTRLKPSVAEGLGQISIKVQKGHNKFATELSVDGKTAGVYQYDANSGRSIAEVYPEYKGKGFGKILVLHAIYTAAKLGMDFVEDESRTAEYDNVLDSLDSNGLVVNDDGYWYVTGEGEQYLKQRLKQGVTEEQLDELSFLGSQCTKDCSGHRAGYEWSKRKGLRQANSWSPSFNKGAGLAVAGK